jgi:hypothetical protein
VAAVVFAVDSAISSGKRFRALLQSLPGTHYIMELPSPSNQVGFMALRCNGIEDNFHGM